MVVGWGGDEIEKEGGDGVGWFLKEMGRGGLIWWVWSGGGKPLRLGDHVEQSPLGEREGLSECGDPFRVGFIHLLCVCSSQHEACCQGRRRGPVGGYHAA